MIGFPEHGPIVKSALASNDILEGLSNCLYTLGNFRKQIRGRAFPYDSQRLPLAGIWGLIVKM